MQNQNSVQSFLLRLAVKLALPFAVFTLLVLCAVSLFAQSRFVPQRAASLSVTHVASGHGVVSPGCAAVLNGGQFTAEGHQAIRWPLPTELAGVTVKVGGIEAAIYAVDVHTVRFIVPDVPRKSGLTWDTPFWRWRDVTTKSPVRFSSGIVIGNDRPGSAITYRELEQITMGNTVPNLPATQPSLIRWHRVEVTSPFGNYSGWAALAPTSPGFYEQTDAVSGQTVPQGVYIANRQAPALITAAPIPNADTALILTGSGFLRAKALFAFISDEADGYWVVPIAAAKMGLFDWIENVTIPIPPDAHGRLTITAHADAMWSQQVQVMVE